MAPGSSGSEAGAAGRLDESGKAPPPAELATPPTIGGRIVQVLGTQCRSVLDPWPGRKRGRWPGNGPSKPLTGGCHSCQPVTCRSEVSRR